jgi:hypothetical protein
VESGRQSQDHELVQGTGWVHHDLPVDQLGVAVLVGEGEELLPRGVMGQLGGCLGLAGELIGAPA